jgi:uncharacterized protein (TIGR02145 family)
MMKLFSSIRTDILITVSYLIMILSGCSKDNNSSVPTLTTTSATYVGQNWAALNATIIPDNKTGKIAFDYDTSTAFRYSVKAIPDTISGTASATFYAVLKGLSSGTTYYFRVKEIISEDTTFGTDKSFVTTDPASSVICFNSGLTYGSVTDIDGNTYKTVEIGAQTWMAENLKTTRYNDGTEIPLKLSSLLWEDTTSLSYCYYNNDSIVYGALYNWYTVNANDICPAGWHIPTDDEWTTLSSVLGGENVAGSKLKETGTTHWNSPNEGATNESGFTALAGGYRSASGTYNNIKRYGYFWTSTGNTSTDAFCRYIYYVFNTLNQSSSNKMSGLSVRCIKD